MPTGSSGANAGTLSTPSPGEVSGETVVDFREVVDPHGCAVDVEFEVARLESPDPVPLLVGDDDFDVHDADVDHVGEQVGQGALLARGGDGGEDQRGRDECAESQLGTPLVLSGLLVVPTVPPDDRIAPLTGS